MIFIENALKGGEVTLLLSAENLQTTMSEEDLT